VIAFVRLAITLALLVTLTPTIGITGPAIALLAGYVAVIVLSGLSLRPSLTRPLRATWPLRERAALLAAYCAGFAVAHVIEHAVPSTGGMLLSLIAGTTAYLLAFAVGGGVNARDRRRLTEGLAMARSWRMRTRSSPLPDAHLQAPIASAVEE
jgi:O-antigen/teichoic acid export membrane protein